MRPRAIWFLLCSLCLLTGVSHPALASDSEPAEARHVELVGHLDIEGGGMVDVSRDVAYIGHMRPPFATTVVDVSDPTDPREIALLPAGGTSIMNAPAGVHRFEFDCDRELAYISTKRDDFRGNILSIVDLSDPFEPTEIGRWWLEGQWIGGGEEPTWSRNDHRVHHPNRLGDRLYVPLWYGGFAIVDISDTASPKTIVHVDHHQPSSTHTTLPIAHEIGSRRWLLVFDEDISDDCEDPPASMWLYDVSNEAEPRPVSSFRVAEGGRYSRRDGTAGKRFRAHQPYEFADADNLVYAAWFAGGLRIIDISDSRTPEEVGHYVPEPVEGFRFPQSNDVFGDVKGWIYPIDRNNGFDILRRSETRTEARARLDRHDGDDLP